MGDQDFSPHDLLRLRRGAHQFLRRHAALAWDFQPSGDRWEILLPPDVAALPERQRFRVHARQEARRLAEAQLYDLDSETAVLAGWLGAEAFQGREDAGAQVGHPGVTTTLGLQPPVPSGFVRWRGSIGCNRLGAPVVACHWGPASVGGHWLAWWADGQVMAALYAAEAAAAGQHLSPAELLEAFGPLWYDHQEMLFPGGDRTRRGRSIPEPATANAVPSASEPGTPGLLLLCTTLATWSLLTGSDAVNLSQQPVSAAEQAADLAAGLRPGPVTVATAVSAP
jgi:hypothetical protein